MNYDPSRHAEYLTTDHTDSTDKNLFSPIRRASEGLRGGTNVLDGTARRLTYCYDNMGNRKWSKREDGTGDVFGYDYADQVTAVKLDVLNPESTSVGPQTIAYDANGNRTSFSHYGTTDTYATNNLNQYSSRNTINYADYDNNGNLNTPISRIRS